MKNEARVRQSNLENDVDSKTVVQGLQKPKRTRRKKMNCQRELSNEDNADSNANNMDNKKMKLNLSDNKYSIVELQGNQKQNSKITFRNVKVTEPKSKFKSTMDMKQSSKVPKNDIKRKIFVKKSKFQMISSSQSTMKYSDGNQCIKLDNGRQISDERLRAYGSSMYKFHKKQKYKNKQQNK